nr:serine/arginine repetitive matrix protein 1-like [Aegilops tauschii subsp. strangulata]
MDPRPAFDFDLNELPPPDDGFTFTVDAQTAREPSPSPLDDGVTEDALMAREPSPPPRGDASVAREPSPPPRGDASVASEPSLPPRGDASAAREPSPSPPPQDDGMGDDATPEMLDLDCSVSLVCDDDDEEEEEGEIGSEPPSPCESDAARSASPTRSPSPAKMERSCSPSYPAEVSVAGPTAQACSQAGVDRPTARLSSCVVVNGAAPFSPSVETNPPPPTLPPPSPSGSSPSRAHAKATSDTSSSDLSRRLKRPFVRRDVATSNHPGNYDVASHGERRPTPPGYPLRRDEGGRRSYGPAMRDRQAPRRYEPYNDHDQKAVRHQQAPRRYEPYNDHDQQAMRHQQAPRRYEPYNDHDQKAMRDQQAPRRFKPFNEHDQGRRGYHGDERQQDYRAQRGYGAPNFPTQQGNSYPLKQFAGPRRREDGSYGGRRVPAEEAQNGGYRRERIPAEEVQNGGYRQYTEPPRVHFRPPAAQPYYQQREPPRAQFPSPAAVKDALARRPEVDRGFGPVQKKQKRDDSPQDDCLPLKKQWTKKHQALDMDSTLKNWIPRARRTRENWCEYHHSGNHGAAQCRRLKQLKQIIQRELADASKEDDPPKGLLQEVIQIEGEPFKAIADGSNSDSR